MLVAVVMVEAVQGRTGPVVAVQGARRAAAADLIEQLTRQTALERILIVSPDPDGLEIGQKITYIPSQPGPIHVGRWLANLTDQFDIDRLLYFGGGAAPLLSDATLTQLIQDLAAAERMLFVNNLHSSDWAALTPAAVLADWLPRLPADNMLGWVLANEANLPAHVLPATAESRLDIDTPVDLLVLSLHPAVKPRLRDYLATLALDTERLSRALAVLATPDSGVLIAGRLGPQAWLALNKTTHCRLRVIAEERGMVSNLRQTRGQVFSILADYLAHIGPGAFFNTLDSQAAAAFIDTRVLLAHHRRWPDVADRFASDLGLADQIGDDWLRKFTAACMAAPIPVILGGHGLLSGDLFALADLLATPQ
jgi:hypothetical protein